VDTATNAATFSPTRTTRDWLKVASIILTCIGIFIAGYVVVTEILNIETICPKTSTISCDVVQHSVYSKVGPIPVAFLGLGGYVLILLVLLLETHIPFLAARGKMIVFGLTLFGVLFSGYLTSIEAFVLHTWCLWCVASAITMTLLFIVSFARLWRSMSVVPLDDEE
jgi:uncharacterized membrane protein